MTPKQLLTIFDQAYRENNEGIPAPINGSKDGPLAAKLIKRGYTDEQLTRWSQLFFIIPDQFIKRTGYTFGIFYSQIGLVIHYDKRRVAHEPQRPVMTPERAQRLLELRKQIDRDDYNVR